MWEKVDVVFKLKSPLHIGYMPFKGSVVSPTRYYVPGRNLWGAITKRVTEYLCEKPKADDYKKIGKQTIENFRFSYFYLYDGRTIYFPRYTDEELKYGNNKKEITKSEFERRFIGSLISTAIDSNGTAKDESLHEIEFINNRFKDANKELKDVKIAGCIWLKETAKIENKKVIINDEGIFIGDFNVIRELILGGESKYVLLDSVNKINFPDLDPFKWKNPIQINIESGKPIICHLKYHKNIKSRGDIELLAGRGYFDPKRNEDKKDGESLSKPGAIISKPDYYFTPGTVILKNWKGRINWSGTAQIIDD
jgi:hypothetical protein